MTSKKVHTPTKESDSRSKNRISVVIKAILVLIGLSLLLSDESSLDGLVGLGIIVFGLVMFRKYMNRRSSASQNLVRVSLPRQQQPVQVLEQLQAMHPVEFEDFVATLFETMGYSVEVTPTVGDEGIDLVVRKAGRLGVVQCKRYRGNVGQPVVRDLYGAMMHFEADEAFLITTGQISLPAKTWRDSKPIHLIDGDRLIELVNRQQIFHEVDHR